VAAKASALGSNPLKRSESVVRDMLRGAGPQSQVTEPPREASQNTELQTMLRKTIYFDEAEWQAIRARCFKDDSTYTDVVRAAVRIYLGIV
jgi:hypothetical protein